MHRGNGTLKQDMYKIEKAVMKVRNVIYDSVHCAREHRITNFAVTCAKGTMHRGNCRRMLPPLEAGCDGSYMCDGF